MLLAFGETCEQRCDCATARIVIKTLWPMINHGCVIICISMYHLLCYTMMTSSWLHITIIAIIVVKIKLQEIENYFP